MLVHDLRPCCAEHELSEKADSFGKDPTFWKNIHGQSLLFRTGLCFLRQSDYASVWEGFQEYRPWRSCRNSIRQEKTPADRLDSVHLAWTLFQSLLLDRNFVALWKSLDHWDVLRGSSEMQVEQDILEVTIFRGDPVPLVYI